MREAFVLRLSPESRPAAREFAGWIEEIDTARELRFRSTEELLAFLSQCLDDARRRTTHREQAAIGREGESGEG